MDEEHLNKAVQQIKEIKMTSEERARMLENILGSKIKTKHGIRSPYFLSLLVSLCCLVVIISSATVVYARGSLPGSTLYSLKVNVLEPARGAFIFSPVKKIQYESDLATERIVEAEILAGRDDLDEQKVDRLNALLEKHTKTFNAATVSFREDASHDEDSNDDIVTNFQAQMNAHARLLEVISEREDKKNEQHQKISKTARDNAIKVRSSIATKKDTIPERYKKRKDTVTSLIDSTDTDLGQTDTTVSPKKKRIVEDTHKTLDEARKFLKEGDDDDKAGNFNNAYGKLLDSESSAKEADIFFKAGIKLESAR